MADTKVNLKQLSQKLGLSQTTVSRALNGFPEVKEKTRLRVLEAASRFNYRPSPSASSLATGKTRIIGHVIPLSDHALIDPHFSDFVAGAGEVYSNAEYDMLIRVVPKGDEESVYRDFASTNRVDGVVVHGPGNLEPRIPLLQELGLPFVVHGRSENSDQNYAWLDVNNRRAFMRATEFLMDLGHQRIALINGVETMNFASRRREGYENALEAKGLQPDVQLMTSEDMVEPYGFRVTSELLAKDNPPTAILCASILPGMGIVRALGEAGLRPGTDISIIVFDDELSFLQDNQPGQVPFFTAMRSSIRKAGSRCAEILLDQINNPSPAPVQELWEAELIVGKTTGVAKG